MENARKWNVTCSSAGVNRCTGCHVCTWIKRVAESRDIARMAIVILRVYACTQSTLDVVIHLLKALYMNQAFTTCGSGRAEVRTCSMQRTLLCNLILYV